MIRTGKWIVVLAFAGSLLACSSGSKSSRCTTDSECGQGKVCQDKVCTVRKCDSAADCTSADQVCVALGADPNAKVCTLRECNTTDKPCTAPNTICEGGICKPSNSPDTLGEDVQGQDVVGTDARPDGTESVEPPPAGIDCKPCKTKADCGVGGYCSAVGSGKFCLRGCSGDSDCLGGYICYQVSTEGTQCLPLSNKCVDCAYAGCPDGQFCHLVTGECKPKLKECDKCTYDFECGIGSRCYKKGAASSGVCVAECGKTGTCSDVAKFTCGPNDKGVKVCIPGDKVCDSCPADKPVPCDDVGGCCQCLNSTHCTPPQTCDTTTHTCGTTGTCSGSTPKKCNDGQCHQCCVDADCPADIQGNPGKCQSFKCTTSGPDQCGGTCEPPFGACALVNGQWQCVECATDADCTSPCKCNAQLNSCLKDDGSTCTSDCVAKCTDDSTCVGPAGEEYKCHSSKVCYNPAGGCDNITACCGPGQTCVDLLGLLMPGGMPGMPGMPGGGMPGSGMAYCSCNSPSDCLSGEPCTDMGMLCIIPFIKDIVCAGGSLPSNIPQKMCFDISKLLGGLGI